MGRGDIWIAEIETWQGLVSVGVKSGNGLLISAQKRGRPRR